MQRPRIALACALALLATLAGCTVPRSGPTASDILSGGEELGMHVVTVTPAIAETTRIDQRLGFGPEFTNAPVVSPDTIRAGDLVSVNVWENVDTGLLAGIGQRVTPLERIQVDQMGNIYVPYAGTLPAAGRTPSELRDEITASLQSQTPDPQVEVRRASGDGATVSVLGAVRAPGVYPIEAPTRRLSSMLAVAGGVAVVPDVAQVKLERGGKVGRIWLQDLYDTPRYDVALRGGDRIIVEEDRRSFTALGATQGQRRIPFDKRDMTALEAIATAGGLDGFSADPTGVFIFRDEPAEVARRVLGASDLAGPQRMAYIIDLTGPEGLFAAREFVVRDEDTVYITEAPIASWARMLTIATATAGLTRTVEVIAQ
ncbi:polysaccharide biosynthesis/export family protein [Amaricoccus sp.]|mgnify:CR=1 FL=1|uniref:polysaccharide biosynthesis/export family protein n=1 Tax=Amaricoccus sp. TaxID=1872485 RepID=UPI0026151959|nr:polysaccharide biosynthesis/export family protein [Amaricoccus sp.]HRO10784.1 polysaccharide biosynthesis/export family protein [Amaricoccus sp.]